MVKASDLGYASRNLQDLPTKEEIREGLINKAVQNLAGSASSDFLSKRPLPPRLLELKE